MIKVLLAEDVHMMRGALVALLNLEPDIEVVADLPSAEGVLDAALRLQPDVAVLDIDLPGRDGLSVAIDLRSAVPGCHALLLTSLSRPAVVRRALDAKVHGFVLKGSPSAQLAEAVRDVARGQRVMDANLVFDAWEESETCPLSARERELLRLVGEGLGVPELATRLFLSRGTVRNHLTSAVKKLEARNRVDAVRLAREADWI